MGKLKNDFVLIKKSPLLARRIDRDIIELSIVFNRLFNHLHIFWIDGEHILGNVEI